MKRIVAGAILAIGTLTAADALAEPSSVAVEHVWARATPKGAAASSFLSTARAADMTRQLRQLVGGSGT